MPGTSGDHLGYCYGSILVTDCHGFYEDSHNLQSPSEPYCFQIIYHIPINLLEEEAMDPLELPPMTQRNSGSNAAGVRGDARNK